MILKWIYTGNFGSKCGRVLNDKDARDVIGLSFHSGARSWISYSCLLRFQW